MITLGSTALGDAASDLLDARLRAGNTIRFVVPTVSMFPTLAPGDAVIVHSARAEELEPGNIVVVKAHASPPRWIVHRFIARRVVDGCAHFVTKGDNCATFDALWTESQLCGIVTTVQRPNAAAPVDLCARRARLAGKWLAFLSRTQGNAYAWRRGFLRRVALKASRALLRASALGARWLVG